MMLRKETGGAAAPPARLPTGPCFLLNHTGARPRVEPPRAEHGGSSLPASALRVPKLPPSQPPGHALYINGSVYMNHA